jgi:hypothetical protein
VNDEVAPPEMARLVVESDKAKSGEDCCPPPPSLAEFRFPQPATMQIEAARARHIETRAAKLKRSTNGVFIKDLSIAFNLPRVLAILRKLGPS